MDGSDQAIPQWGVLRGDLSKTFEPSLETVFDDMFRSQFPNIFLIPRLDGFGCALQ